MKFFIKRALLVFILFSAFLMPAVAQRGGNFSSSNSSQPAVSRLTLTVNCNISNAKVEISSPNDKSVYYSRTAPVSVQLEPNTYTVTVSASGYDSQQQTFLLDRSQTLNFNLGATKAALQIQSNARNARVVITGSNISGQLIGSAPFTAQIAHGRYDISVSAPGYISQSRSINLNSPATINFNLDVETYNMNITSNVDGAKVFIRGGNINGQLTGTTDMTTVLPPGTYQVKVNAPGYYAEEQTVSFNRSMNLNFQLRARTARLDIIIPNNILDYSQQNPAGKIKIFDNGSQVNGTSLALSPGQHTIRITSGGVASQQTINVRAGESYRMELNFGFSLIRE